MNFFKYFILLLPLFLAISCTDQEGCTDVNACNYDADADTNDGSCLVIGQSCDDGNSATYNDVVTAACTCAGCTGTLSFMVDGVAWEYDNLTAVVQTAPTDGLPSKTLQINASKSGASIVLSFASLAGEDSCMPLQTYYEDFEQAYCETGNSSLVCEALVIFYNEGAVTANSLINVEGSGVLTACDSAAKTITGNFDGTVTDFFNETIIEISGSFENLCYTEF